MIFTGERDREMVHRNTVLKGRRKRNIDNYITYKRER